MSNGVPETMAKADGGAAEVGCAEAKVAATPRASTKKQAKVMALEADCGKDEMARVLVRIPECKMLIERGFELATALASLSCGGL